MISKLFSLTALGLKARLIEIEVDLSPSLPMITMVGLPDKAVQESKERIRSALKESGFEFPLGKLTINLAPANINKSGSAFDLPIAVGILHLTGFIKNKLPEKTLFIGELSLEGKLRKVDGVLSHCLWARKNNFQKIFIPAENSKEASLVKDLQIYPVMSLTELVKHLNDGENIEKLKPTSILTLVEKKQQASKISSGQKLTWKGKDIDLLANDMAYIKGQEMAKRALEIAAAGGHNVLFIGSPGSGKTLLARSYPTILPKMTEEEVLEVTQIYSVAGALGQQEIILERPFRSPHHTSSNISLVGGGTKLRPGEISLAHRGVLFLDEFPEFDRHAIESLRQPLEDGYITISRANGSVRYPSKFYLLAAANPTPGGFDPDDTQAANKPQNRAAISRYQAKFSGPILDRIDLQVEVNRPDKDSLEKKELSEPSEFIAIRCQKARNIQTERFQKDKIYTNNEMNLPMIEKYCLIKPEGKKLLSQAVDKFQLSARSYMRIIKLSRTIADLANNQEIELTDIAEALQYRGRWG
jgi:magnesium chelatase family protein